MSVFFTLKGVLELSAILYYGIVYRIPYTLYIIIVVHSIYFLCVLISVALLVSAACSLLHLPGGGAGSGTGMREVQHCLAPVSETPVYHAEPGSMRHLGVRPAGFQWSTFVQVRGGGVGEKLVQPKVCGSMTCMPLCPLILHPVVSPAPASRCIPCSCISSYPPASRCIPLHPLSPASHCVYFLGV